MKERITTRRRIPSLLAKAGILAAAFAAGALYAQSSGLQRTIVQRADVSVPGREAVVARVELAPGVQGGRHTHPGDEITYVQEGELELLVDGQAPRRVKAGEAFVIPAGIKHDARNDGTVPVKLIGIYVVDKGQPLATPAP